MSRDQQFLWQPVGDEGGFGFAVPDAVLQKALQRLSRARQANVLPSRHLSFHHQSVFTPLQRMIVMLAHADVLIALGAVQGPRPLVTGAHLQPDGAQ